MQDELADLMSRNMHISVVAPVDITSNPPTPQDIPQAAPVYISQHYTHSAHIIPVLEESSMMVMLQESGVDAKALLPAQIELFKNAQPEQRNRLVELWRIAPPTRDDQHLPAHMAHWSQTSFELEEEAARSRWERQEQEKLKNLSVLQTAEPYMVNGYQDDMAMDDEPQPYRAATDPVHNRQREWWNMADDQPMEHQYGMLQQMQMVHGFCGVANRERLW